MSSLKKTFLGHCFFSSLRLYILSDCRSNFPVSGCWLSDVRHPQSFPLQNFGLCHAVLQDYSLLYTIVCFLFFFPLDKTFALVFLFQTLILQSKHSKLELYVQYEFVFATLLT